MFGYDRDEGLMRVYIPPKLLKLFTDLNKSHRALVDQVVNEGIENLNIVYPKGIKPTRQNVVDADYLNLIVGGVSYFPNYPINHDFQKLNKLLGMFKKDELLQTSFLDVKKILNHIASEDVDDWNQDAFLNALSSIQKLKSDIKIHLLIRTERRLSRGTGTMLSENDRRISNSYSNDIVLILYKITGERELGWDGSPIWLPNVRFPKNYLFYKTI